MGTPNTHTKIKSSDQQLTVGSTTITLSDSAHNLEVSFDKYMAMEKDVTSVCKSTKFHL